MPCDSSYLEQSDREIELQTAAQLYLHVCYKLDRVPPKNLVKQATDYYAKIEDGDSVALLCELLKSLNEDQLDKVVYDAYSPQSRKLAEWWEEHQRIDRDREAYEAEYVMKQEAIKSGLAKLTSEEKKALGIKEL